MDGEIREARALAEKRLGFEIPDEVAEEVLQYADRKRRLNNKPESYLPLLYENELRDHFMRLAITMRGEMNRVCNLQKVSV